MVTAEDKPSVSGGATEATGDRRQEQDVSNVSESGQPESPFDAKTVFEKESSEGTVLRGFEVVGGRYQIVGRGASGGMGTVYEAHDTRLGRTVAVKRLLGDHQGSERSIARFLNEARSVASLSHPNIVQVFDVGRDETGDYIVMEWVDGSNLAQLIKERGSLTVPEALEIFRSVCAGVSYAHRRNVIHRDIKPSNILIALDGLPRIVDFGLARKGSESGLSVTGVCLGTTSYMAPEQRIDAKRCDHRSDVYSLAKTLYAMITGDTPDVVDPDAVPQALRRPLLRAMKACPSERYFSVDEMLRDIEAALVSERASKVAVTPVRTGPANMCECGCVHDPADRYCPGCGKTLFSTCPVEGCGGEVRSGGTHCPTCGLEIAEFETYCEHRARAEEQLRDGHFNGAEEEASAILQMRPSDHLAREILTKVTEARAKLDALAAECRRMIEEGQLDEAESLTRDMRDIDAASPDVPSLLELIHEHRQACELDALRERMFEYAREGHTDEGAAIAQQILAIDESDKQAASMLQRFEEEDATLRASASVTQMVADADAALARSDFGDAFNLARAALDIDAGHVRAREILVYAGRKKDLVFYKVLAGFLVGGIMIVIAMAAMSGQ